MTRLFDFRIEYRKIDIVDRGVTFRECMTPTGEVVYF